jgi:hypothetical protein
MTRWWLESTGQALEAVGDNGCRQGNIHSLNPNVASVPHEPRICRGLFISGVRNWRQRTVNTSRLIRIYFHRPRW